jgi:hypothetical protein
MTADSSDNRAAALEALAGRLVAETGISASQAKELIFLVGVNWSSLVREAKLLAAWKD